MKQEITQRIKDNKTKTEKPQGFAILSTGRTGTGKTTFIKKLVDKVFINDEFRDILIFDPNHEYGEYTEGVYHDDWKEFSGLVSNATNSLIVIEEATISLDPRKKEGVMVDKLVKKRHENNILVFNFHSWGAVPFYIFHLVDFVTIFKTNDTDRVLKNKCDMPKVLEAYDKVQKSENRFSFKTIDLYK